MSIGGKRCCSRRLHRRRDAARRAAGIHGAAARLSPVYFENRSSWPLRGLGFFRSRGLRSSSTVRPPSDGEIARSCAMVAATSASGLRRCSIDRVKASRRDRPCELVGVAQLRGVERAPQDRRSTRHTPSTAPGTDGRPCRRARTRSAPDRRIASACRGRLRRRARSDCSVRGPSCSSRRNDAKSRRSRSCASASTAPRRSSLTSDARTSWCAGITSRRTSASVFAGSSRAMVRSAVLRRPRASDPRRLLDRAGRAGRRWRCGDRR